MSLKSFVKVKIYDLLSALHDFNPEDSIVLFCDPRGGSTWLAETFNKVTNTMIVDEPFHLNNSPYLEDMYFSWRSQFITINEDRGDVYDYLIKLKKGKALTRNMCLRNTVREVIGAKQSILKIIRGKTFLPWYVNRFPTHQKPILMIRNPFAMVASMLSHPSWDYPFKQFTIPNAPNVEIYEKHINFLRSLKTKEQQLASFWCINNLVPWIDNMNQDKWILIFYEHIARDPEHLFSYIYKEWHKPMPDILLKNITKASSSNVDSRAIDKENQFTKWRNYLSDEQINLIQEVLDYFQIKVYHKSSDYPVNSIIKDWISY